MDVFKVKISEETDNDESLYSLCQKEAKDFSNFLRKNPTSDRAEWMYKDGLADWEEAAVAGYLYQKSKGRF